MTFKLTPSESETITESETNARSVSIWLTAAAQNIHREIVEALPHLKDLPCRDIPRKITEDITPFELITVIESVFHIGSRNITAELIEKLKRINVEAFGTAFAPKDENIYTGLFKFVRAISYKERGEAMFRFDIAAFGTRK